MDLRFCVFPCFLKQMISYINHRNIRCDMGRIVTSLSIDPDIYEAIKQLDDFKLSTWVNKQLRVYFAADNRELQDLAARKRMLKEKVEEIEGEILQLSNRMDRIQTEQNSEKDEFMNNIGNLLIREGLGWNDVFQRYKARFGEIENDDWETLKASYGY